ncbi:MAG TPA: hypothetical protein VIK73_00560 [Limnochordales bacterium]
MALDKQQKEELRAVVASELQDVLRQELAQWWVESVMALSASRQGSGGHEEASSPPESGQSVQDGGYLLQMAESLARAHRALADDMLQTMKRLQRIMSELESLVERNG